MTILDQFPIFGRVATGFEPVRATFEKNFVKYGEVGPAVHVLLNEEPVVVWGGAADAAGSQPRMVHAHSHHNCSTRNV